MNKNQNMREILNKEHAIVLFNQLTELFFKTWASNTGFARWIYTIYKNFGTCSNDRKLIT